MGHVLHGRGTSAINLVEADPVEGEPGLENKRRRNPSWVGRLGKFSSCVVLYSQAQPPAAN